MASAIIHLCIAKEVNKVLGMDEKTLFLGTIAPDISKEIGQSKEISHFLDHSNENNIPNIDRFLKKYRDELVKPFEMGYFIHLLTDKYWFRDYFYEFVERYVTETGKKDLTESALNRLIYDDYTNINIDLIDKYGLSLELFYEEFKYPTSKIIEIPMDELPIIVEKMGIIIENSKEEKTFVFDTYDIVKFIDQTVKYIIRDIQMLGLNKVSQE